MIDTFARQTDAIIVFPCYIVRIRMITGRSPAGSEGERDA